MPYWRLSGFYFFYFATLGILISYWGLYLEDIGFTASQIGYVIALISITRIIAPNIWAWLADHQGQRMRVVRLASLLAAVSFVGTFLGTDFWWVVVVIFLFSFFWNASLPQVEAATMSHSAGEAGSYTRVRLWGSVGFILAVMGLGTVLDVSSYWWVLPVMLVSLVGIAAVSFTIPESRVDSTGVQPQSFLKVILRPEVSAFLLVCFLMQASHGPYYTFYSIYLNAEGYSKTIIGLLWTIGVIAEIVFFLMLHRLKRRISLRQMMLASSALAVIRWLLIGFFPQEFSVLIIAQLLHAVTFGAYHATAIVMVHKFFAGRHHGRGQAIYGSISFGIGGALGSIYSGLIWQDLGATVTFALAAVLAFLAFVVTWFFIKPRS